MTLITLDAARTWLRVGSEISDTDLQDLIDDATQSVADFMGRPIISAADDDNGWAEADVPKTVITAIKVTLVVMYDNREAPLVHRDVMLSLVGRYCITSFA